MRFYVPPNLQQDFKDALASKLGTEFVINFDTTATMRAIVKEIDYRAKADESIRNEKPMYASIDNTLDLGDYLQDANFVYIITQMQIMRFPECYKVYAHICNNKLTVTTFQQATYDGNGNPTSPGGDVPIVEDYYCSTNLGMFQFTSTSTGVGIVPTNEVSVSMQYNDKTKAIDIDNNFDWFGKKYQIISVDHSQIDSNGKGILSFTGKKLVSDATQN